MAGSKGVGEGFSGALVDVGAVVGTVTGPVGGVGVDVGTSEVVEVELVLDGSVVVDVDVGAGVVVVVVLDRSGVVVVVVDVVAPVVVV